MIMVDVATTDLTTVAPRRLQWKNSYRAVPPYVWTGLPTDIFIATHWNWPCPQKAEQIAIAAIAHMAKTGKWPDGSVVYAGPVPFEGGDA